jgi:hypothetical protein
MTEPKEPTQEELGAVTPEQTQMENSMKVELMQAIRREEGISLFMDLIPV